MQRTAKADGPLAVTVRRAADACYWLETRMSGLMLENICLSLLMPYFRLNRHHGGLAPHAIWHSFRTIAGRRHDCGDLLPSLVADHRFARYIHSRP